MKRIVVIGGGYAGQCALVRVRSLDAEVEVVLVEPRSAFEERVRLHEALAWKDNPSHDLAVICERLRVRHIQARADRIGPGVVWVGGQEVSFDAAVVALGSRSRPLEGAVTMDSVAEARALALTLSGKVSVVGAGFTGLEVASELARARPDLDVEIVRRAPRWSNLSASANQSVDQRLAQLGVAVVDVSSPNTTRIACTGMVPLTLSGLTPGEDGRVDVDEMLQALPGVFVAGDMAHPPDDPGTGCVSAMPMGMRAAENALAWVQGGPMTPFSMDKVLACVSLGRGAGVAQRIVDGEPTWAVGGRMGGMVKSGILRYTTSILTVERWAGRPVYRWPEKGAA